MKGIHLVVIFVVIGLCGLFVSADLIEPGTHYVDKCIKLSNMTDYNTYTFFNVGTLGNDSEIRYLSIATPNTCLEQGYKYNSYKLMAITTESINLPEIEQKINDMQYSDIDLSAAISTNVELAPFGGYVVDANPIISEKVIYSIKEINFNQIILTKTRKETEYSNGIDKKVEIFDEDSNTSFVEPKDPILIDKIKEPTIIDSIICFFRSIFGMTC